MKIVEKARRMVGVRKFRSSSWVLWRGVRVVGPQRTEMARRVEYAAVRVVARIKIEIIRILVGLNRSISKIISLE